MGRSRPSTGGGGADPPPRINPEAEDVRLPAVGVGSPGLKPPAPFERSWRSRWCGSTPTTEVCEEPHRWGELRVLGGAWEVGARWLGHRGVRSTHLLGAMSDHSNIFVVLQYYIESSFYFLCRVGTVGRVLSAPHPGISYAIISSRSHRVRHGASIIRRLLIGLQ